MSRTTSRPNAGWLARTANLSALFDTLLPLLRERWRHTQKHWEGPLILDVEGSRWYVEFSDSDMHRLQESPEGAPVVRLSSGALAQLVFGYRPAPWVANRAEQTVPADLVPVLANLFPTSIAWYAGSNRC